MPTVLIEAISCGRALMATDVLGRREIIRDGENENRGSHEKLSSLGDSDKKLIGKALLRKAMEEKGRELVRTDFSTDKIVSATLQVYKN